jgi:arginyl-tRNA synthetase
MHIGHIRSTIIGDCIARVLEVQGHNVVRQNHVGDWGTQFGMLLTYLTETGEDSEALADIEDFYRAAKTRFDEDDEFKARSRQSVVALQAKDVQMMAQWYRFIDMSVSHCQGLYTRMGVKLTRDDIRGESSYNDGLGSMIDLLAEANLLKESDGAQCIFLEEFKNKTGDILPLIVRKSDGGYLYATTDMVALQHRAQTLAADRILYFVDARQSLHFKQVFAAARAAGFVSDRVELAHMQFGTMLGKDNKPFKTREGALIKLADLLDEAIERAQSVLLEKRGSEAIDIAKLAKVIGIGAVKYADLSKNRTSDYVFDWDQMLSFEGNTSPYLQYAYSRIQSIFRKGNVALEELPEQILTVEEAERRLAVAIAGFDDTLDLVGKEGSPHYLCSYLYDLAGRFTQFYEQCPILASERDAKTRRLRLAQQSGQILAMGLDLLGIDVVERM